MGLRNGILIRIRKKHIRIGNKFDCVEGVNCPAAARNFGVVYRSQTINARKPGKARSTSAWKRKATESYDGVTRELGVFRF